MWLITSHWFTWMWLLIRAVIPVLVYLTSYNKISKSEVTSVAFVNFSVKDVWVCKRILDPFNDNHIWQVWPANYGRDLWQVNGVLMVLENAEWGICFGKPHSYTLNSNLAKSRSSITSVWVAQSFWNFAQSMAVALLCSVHNFETIGSMKISHG